MQTADESGPMPPEPPPGSKYGRQDITLDEILLRYFLNAVLIAAVTILAMSLARWLLNLLLGGFLEQREIWTKAIPFGIGIGTGTWMLIVVLTKRTIIVNAASGIVTKSILNKSMWSYLQGFYMLLPWETVFKVIDLKRETKMVEDEKDSFLSENDLPMKVKFLIKRRAHPYYLINHVLNDEAAADPVFKARIKSFLTQQVRMKTDGDAINDIGEFKDKFALVFGGPDDTDPLEYAYGVWTGNPELYVIERSKEGQESRAKVVEVQAFSDAVKKHLETMKDLDPNYSLDQAKEDVLLITGEMDKTIHAIEGLGKLGDLPRELRELNLSVVAPGAGSGNSGKNKKHNNKTGKKEGGK